MIAQIGARKIGDVVIIDLKGSFTGPWVERGKKELVEKLEVRHDKPTILNLRSIRSMDSLGAKAISDSLSNYKNVSILAGDELVMDLFERSHFSQGRKIFRNEKDVTAFTGSHLIEPAGDMDRRKDRRLQTAIPLEFYCLDENEPILFQAVVTNLSEGGLFAEYIDLKHAEQSLERLNPYDLHLLHLTIILGKGREIKAEGKVAHRRMSGEQVGMGMEFYRIGEKEIADIRAYLQGEEALSDS